MSVVSFRPIRLVITPEELVSEVNHLPSAPKVLPRLKRLLRDGNSSPEDIVRLVRLDPGIAARVLQLGNSVYFNAGFSTVTVEDAAERLASVATTTTTIAGG